MGGCESELYSFNIDYRIITPQRIPYPDDKDLLTELNNVGIIFNNICNIVDGGIGPNKKILCKIADVTLPPYYGLLKMNNDHYNTSYYLINDKYYPCYYIWFKKDATKKGYISTCGIQRVSSAISKYKIDVTKNGLYNGLWLTNDEIRDIQEKEYNEKITNYKNNLETYNKCSCYDSQLIENEFSKITNEYNVLLLQITAEKLRENNITQPPIKLKSTLETMFVS